jgi:hypothetical protein
MCKFFSLLSDGQGNPLYFDWKIRSALLENNPKNYEPDSHTSIADYYGLKGSSEDRLNKYEYNPFTKVFTIDQLNTKDDSVIIKEFCSKLDFKTIVAPMIIKKIINPFEEKRKVKISQSYITLLREVASVWDSIRASVGASVGNSVWDSIRASVGASVGDSVWDSIRASVGASVWDSIRASVWDSVWASVGASVGDSVMAQTGSMFTLNKWKYCYNRTTKDYPFQPYVDLWNKGLVPSFDGTVWRLHGYKGKVIFTITDKQLKETK